MTLPGHIQYQWQLFGHHGVVGDQRFQAGELFLGSLQAVHLVPGGLHGIGLDLVVPLESQDQFEMSRRTASQKKASRCGLLQVLQSCLGRDPGLIPGTRQELRLLVLIIVGVLVGADVSGE